MRKVGESAFIVRKSSLNQDQKNIVKNFYSIIKSSDLDSKDDIEIWEMDEGVTKYKFYTFMDIFDLVGYFESNWIKVEKTIYVGNI